MMRTRLPAMLGKFCNGLFLACITVFTAAVAYNHLNLVTHPYPLDYNEPGMLVTTATIMAGENPYSLENQPARISLYPVLINLLVAPLSLVLGNTLELHRAVGGLFILGSCALCFYLCRLSSGGRIESFTAAALCYAAFLYYSTPIASANALGLFLFLGAITVPWAYGFSTRSLAAAITLGLLAFYTKQYFIACLGYVALYMFLAVSKQRAIIFGVVALLAFIAVLALVCYTSPYYLEDTFFAVQSSAEYAASDEFVITQLKEFSQIYLPLLVMFSVAVIYKWYSPSPSSAPGGNDVPVTKYVDLRNFDRPLLLRKPDYLWVCCACSVVIVLLVLGKNRGNHLTYFFQLISPFFLAGTFSLVSAMHTWRWPFRILMVLALYNSYFMLPRDFSVDEKPWREIRREMARADDIYGSTLVIREILEKGGPIYLSGGTRYFMYGNDKPSFLTKADPEHRIPFIWDRHVRLIQDKIRRQEFDLLLIDNWMPMPEANQASAIDTQTLLEKYYKKTAKIRLPLAERPGGGTYIVHVWKPVPGMADAPREPL